MNKKLELELVNLHIQDIKDQIQLLEAKLVDLQNQRIELENEIFDEENQANKSIDNTEVNSEWTSEDPTYVMPGITKEEMQMEQEETNQNQVNLGGNNEMEEHLETVQNEEININQNQINPQSISSTTNTNRFELDETHLRIKKELDIEIKQESTINNEDQMSFVQNNNEIPTSSILSVEQETISTQNQISLSQNSQPFESFEEEDTFNSFLNHSNMASTSSNGFNCNQCGKVFSSKSGLKYHLSGNRVHQYHHSGIKEHQCQFCDKLFNNKYNLNIHLRIHTGFKPFPCSQCDFKGNQSSDLLRHVRRKHSGILPFWCSQCPKKYADQSLLNYHIRTKHNILKCNQCDFETANSEELTNHLVIHNV